jgi:tetratricopeptide (TPR) repeat protein
MVENELCNYAAASKLYAQTLVIFRELGDHRSEALTLSNLGAVEHDQGNYATARGLLEESLALFRELGDQHGEARALNIMANGEAEQGRYSDACEMYARSLTIRREIGADSGIAESCAWMAAALVGLRDFAAAAVVVYGGQKAARDHEYSYGPHEQRMIEATLTSLAAAVDTGETGSAELLLQRARGEAMSLDELSAYTLAALEPGNRSL